MSLHVVALISGGKDSLFSILHCLANGHKIVALANLYPADMVDDTDSFMYQTIGHKVIPLYEQALALPLYRQPIHGTAANSDKSYAAAPADEVEDMFTLLRKVKTAHPEINAVCTGAILSDYQRTRVESVAVRLDLISLSYLWQFPFLPPYTETSLLEDMRAVGQDARIIKTASGDLDERDLWADVGSVRFNNKVNKVKKWGTTSVGSGLGEGGEYETLAIDGPVPLWKGRIIVEDQDREAVSGEAGSSSLRILRASVEVKTEGPIETPRIPDLFDVKFARIRDLAHIKAIPGQDFHIESTALDISTWQIQQTTSGRSINNAVGTGADATTQMNDIMCRLISDHGTDPSQIVSTTIILRSMADFPLVNNVYGSYFKTPNPPARVTISCGDCLPRDTHVSLSVLVIDQPHWKSAGLHVQSRSYWAPANIGPYSQAIQVPLPLIVGTESAANIIHVAGQIPLHPASMVPYESASASIQLDQATLALQHLWRIGRVMHVKHWLGAVAYISAAQSTGEARHAAAVVNRCWSEAHKADVMQPDEEEVDEDDFDVWHLQHGIKQLGSGEQSTYSSTVCTDTVPPCFTAEVQELPRGVGVEWHSIGLAPIGSSEDTVLQDTTENGTHTKISLHNNGEQHTIAGFLAIYQADTSVELPDSAMKAITAYTTCWSNIDHIKTLKAQIVPCRSLWDADGSLIHTLITYKVF